MFNKNQIQVKLPDGRKNLFAVKNGKVFDAYGKNKVFCGCTGNTPATATQMEYSPEKGVFCPHCGKKIEVIQTYNEYKAEKEAAEAAKNTEKLENLHLVECGVDWECGIKYYALSAEISHDDWNKVKQHFNYHKAGWSNHDEVEFDNGCEPRGWLTRNPEAVEEILVSAGVMKPENTLSGLSEKKEAEQESQKSEKQLRKEMRKELKQAKRQLRNAFAEARELSDDEAKSAYNNADYGCDEVTAYKIEEDKIIMARNMGDFIFAKAVDFTEKLKELIIKLFQLEYSLSK